MGGVSPIIWPRSRVRNRSGPAANPVLGHVASARKSVPRAKRQTRAARSELLAGIGRRRPNLRKAGQLCAGAHRPAEGRGDQPDSETVCDRRSPRGPWSRYRRLQGGQRNRRRDESWPSLLLRRLPPRPRAGSNHRRHRRAQRRSSSKRSLRCTPKPMANRAWLEIARRAGPS